VIHETDSMPYAAALSAESSSVVATVAHRTPARSGNRKAVVYAGDYLNKLTGESVERECRRKLTEGATEIVVNFSRTELVNSIGVSILLGVIDAAESNGARVVFAGVNESTAELFEMLGLTNHVQLVSAEPTLLP
jgi:anti-anti-sigma factor